MKAAFHSVIESPWTEMEPIRLGRVPPGVGTADEYVLVESAGEPILRVDLYASRDEVNAFADVRVWGSVLLIGWGNRVFAVDMEARRAHSVELEEYFGHFYTGQAYALVASAERLYRLGPDGRVMWRSDPVGIDGVIVDSVESDVITGQGEWDPPGGWQPFRLDLSSGQLQS